jgi:prepilin-type N-terminal cleavage/methylation domain-containing protein
MLTPPFTQAIRSDDGFTLIELLVAMIAGLVVTTAAFGLLQIATEQTSRATDYVQASQLGRTAMSHVVDELNSACLAENATPVGEESGREELYFVTAFSGKTEIQPSEVQEHRIYWKEAKGAEPGGLYDAEAPAESKKGENEWVFKTLPKPGVLIDADAVHAKNAKGENEPFFKYEKYKEVNENGETGLIALKEIELKGTAKLGSTAAKEVASVIITFRSLPVDKNEKVGRYLELSNQVTFAFSAGFTEPQVTNTGACQNQ